MSLQKQVIEIPALGGVDESKSKFLPAPFHRLQNLLATKTGQIGKREGLAVVDNTCVDDTTQPPPGAVVVAGRELVSIGTADEVATDDPGAYLHSYSSTLSQWAPRGPVPETAVRRYPGVRSGAGTGDAPVQVARVGDIECLLFYRDGASTAYYRLVDRATDAVIQGDTSLGDLGKAVLLVVSSKFVIVWKDSVSDDVTQTIVDPSTLGVTTAVAFNIGSGVGSTGWDAIATASGKWCWASVSNVSQLVVKRITLSPVAVDATYLLPAIDCTRIALGFVSGYAYLLVAYDDTGAGQVKALQLIEATMVLALGPWNVVALSTFNGDVIKTLDAQIDDEHRNFIAVGADDLAPYPAWWVRAFDTAGAALMTVRVAYWILQQHRMFRLNGALYVTFSASEQEASKRFGYALVNLSRHFEDLGITRPLALEGNLVPLEGIGASENAILGALPSAFVDGDTAYLALTIGNKDAESGVLAWADVAELSTNRRTDGLWSAAYAADLLHLTGSLGVQYDGASAHEIGFLQAPHPEEAPTLNYGASGLETGTYQYVAIYEWRDAKGLLHRSRVGDAIEAVVGTSGLFTRATVTLQLRHTALTRRPTDTGSGQAVRILVYRTEKDVSGPYYQCAFNDDFNQATESLLVYVDSETDAHLLAAARGEIYTSGGVVDNEPPPPARHVQVSNGRVWLTSAEGREVWPSKTLIAGEAPAFSSLLRITLDDAPDAVIATAGLDGALAIFTESRIYMVQAAAGPARTGAPPWPQPEAVQTSVGCSSSRSVVSFRDGVLFLSVEGIRLLTRGGDLVNVGDAVRDTLAAYPEVIDAVLDGERQRVYFLCSGTRDEGDASAVLVYDYRHGTPDAPMWSTFVFEGGQAIERLAVWQSRMAAAHGGGVLLEAHGATPGWDDFGDGAVWVESLLETPWIHLGALGGYQRVWRVVLEMERAASFGFTAEFCNDGDTTAVQTESFTTTQTGASRRQRWVIGVAQQKCQSFKVRLTDSEPASANGTSPQGFLYHGLSLEIGGKFGVEKAEKGKTRLCSLSLSQAASWPARASTRCTNHRRRRPRRPRHRPTARRTSTATPTPTAAAPMKPRRGAQTSPTATRRRSSKPRGSPRRGSRPAG